MPARFHTSRSTWVIAGLLLLGGGGPALQAQDGSPAGNLERPEKTFEYGPLFKGFLKRNSRFAALLQAKRYQEAAELLDRWAREMPEDIEIRLARTYLLLEQGRLEEAWLEAQAYRGPDPYEVLHRVGLYAWQRATSQGLDAETRAGIIELGIQAETLAMEAREGASEPVLHKSLLLRENAKLAADPQESQALIAEADRLRERAAELQGKESLRKGGRVTRPEKISGVHPNTLEEARRIGVSGIVILETQIDEQGHVQEARILRSLQPELDRIAVDTIRNWKFKPATLDGKPVKVYYTMTMSFHY